MERWELPPPLPRVKTSAGLPVCPFVGLRLPYYAHERHLKKAWFSRREMKSWEIQPLRRRALYGLLKRNFSGWIEWLRYDSTPTFYREMEGFKKRQSGAVIGIAGPKMCGKSRLGQMLLTRFVDTQPHVLFQYKDLEHHVKDRDDLSLAVQIDEDLRSTGHESRNLVIHVNNTFETSRKADLWAVCTGVNLNFKDWGNTLDVRMIPFGFNVDFQATRAAMFDSDKNFLGFAVFQREHLPEDGVFYYNEEGLWGEYEARAKAYSLTVTKKGGVQDAVDALTQTEHIATLKRLLKTDYVKKGLSIPNDIMCRRLYRKADIPTKSVGYMTETIQWAKFELENGSAARGGQGKEGQRIQVDYKEMTSKGWTDLRAALSKMMKCWSCALYYVPPHAQISDREIVEMEGLGIESGSLGTTRRRRLKDLTTLDLGRLGEAACVPWLDSLHPQLGTGTKGQADILVDVDGTECALNVKITLKDGFKESLEMTPEDRWIPNALAVLLVPRHLRIKVFKITGPVMTLNWRRGVLATPDTLAEVIREMLVSENKTRI
jgi:hypothetical protein